MSRAGAGFTLAVLAAAPAWAARPTSAYEQIVAPIFRARCVECHGEQKQKAKLALHTWEAAARGSDTGPVWVAGKPDESSLVERLRLPVDDEEHMPPKEHPQPAPEEIALLARWIERGASATASVAELQLPAPLAAVAAELPAKLAALAPAAGGHDDVAWAIDAAAVAKARAPLAARVAELQKRFPGALSYESRTSPALHFTAVGLGRTFGDAELEQLAGLKDQLVALDVSGTAITDRSAPVLAGFTQVRRLRAASTALGDDTAKAVASLPQLEVLALHHTAVTAACVDQLAQTHRFKKLYLGETAAAPRAREAGLPVIESKHDALAIKPAEEPKAPDSR